MPVTPKKASQVLSDFSANRWLRLHSLQKGPVGDRSQPPEFTGGPFPVHLLGGVPLA